MNWRRLKVFAIAALLVLDAIFLGIIVERAYSASYYDAALVEDALSLYEAVGLHVDARFLKERIAEPGVLSGVYGEDAVGAMRAALTQRGGYLAIDVSNGTRFLGLYDELFIGNDFSFTYSYMSGTEMPLDLLAEGDLMNVTSARYAESAWTAVERFLQTKMMLPDATEKYAYAVKEKAIYAKDSDYIVCVEQSVNGLPLETEAYFLVRDGVVRSAEGVFATVLPTARETAETAGILELLFSERERLAGEEKNVSEISYSRAPYFDAKGRFYLVPLCRIAYDDGEEVIYNFISGKIYAET